MFIWDKIQSSQKNIQTVFSKFIPKYFFGIPHYELHLKVPTRIVLLGWTYNEFFSLQKNILGQNHNYLGQKNLSQETSFVVVNLICSGTMSMVIPRNLTCILLLVL